MITIFKGDDTGGIFGRRVLLTIESDVSLAGCSCDFVLHGITKHIDAPITPGETYELVYTHEETDTMPLGVSRARVVIIDASGRRSTVSNTHRVLVTDVVADILPESSVSVSLHALRIDDIEGLGDALDGKQKKLTAGQNITIADDGTISASGGGGGGGAVSSVNGQTGAVVLTGADIKTSAENDKTVAETLAAKADEFTPWAFGGDVGDWSIVFHSEEEEGAPLAVWYADLLNGGELVHTVAVENQFVTSVSFRWGEDGMVDATRKRVLRTGDADKLTDEQKAILAGGPYLPATENDVGGFDINKSIRVNGYVEAFAVSVSDSLYKGGKAVATEDQLRITMTLVGNDPYTVQLDGETLTFAQIKAYAQTRNAVIQRGQGTYRVTYIGATEMMWDVTGTVQGDVLTGQIHIFDHDGTTVVQRVEPKVLATKPMIDEIKDTVSTDNRFLVNGTTAAIQTRTDETAEWVDQIRVDKGYDALTGSTMVKIDKSVQTVTVAGSNLVIEIPDSVDGTVRDLCVYANNSSNADTALTFPAGTYYGDDPNGAVAKAGKVTAIYLTEIPKGAWMLRITELDQHEVTA